MKLYKSIFLTLAIIAFTSCELDLLDDPNAIKLKEINPTLLANNIQLDFATFFNTASTFGMQMTRMQNSGGADYENSARPTAFDGLWTNAYANILNDANTLIPIADANNYTFHAGIARVISAYVLLTLVDYFGDVPYRDAFGGLSNPNPEADDMADVYDDALALLNQAITNFKTAPNASLVVNDLYYSGSSAKWIRLANSLKLKVYLNMRIMNPTDATNGINAVIADPGGLISTADQSFIFRYATSTADPDSRHPRWIGNWLTGAGDYIANYLMWQMNFGYDMQDPRMRFYFYRQRTSNSTNPNEIRCILELVPSHYPGVAGGNAVAGPGGFPPGITQSGTNPAWSRTFCFPTSAGYWGRDHVDPQGIPPDGLARTTWGAYPVGGRYDANNGLAVTNSSTLANSMRGAGIQPIMMRSSVDFMLAEAANYLAVIPPAPNNTAALRFEAGIRNSMADVRAWAVNGTLGTNSFGSSPNQGTTIEAFQSSTAYQTAVDTYVTAALARYNAQVDNDGRMNFIAREYWISLFGSGVEAYNMYRRTGMPTGMQPTISPTPGPFPRSFWYPVVYSSRNANAEQKANLTGKVFWDDGSTNLDF
jgi:hypothetical protein